MGVIGYNRAQANGSLMKTSFSNLSKTTMTNDTMWNLAPASIKQCESLYSAKRFIKTFNSIVTSNFIWENKIGKGWFPDRGI